MIKGGLPQVCKVGATFLFILILKRIVILVDHISKKLEKAITQKCGPGMFSLAPATFVSPPDSCVRSWCPCDGIGRWPKRDTSSWEWSPQEWGQCSYRKATEPLPLSPCDVTWTRPWPWHQWHLAFSLQNGLLFISLPGCGLLLQQPKETRDLSSRYFCEKGCVCVLCVLCMCYVGVLRVCSVCVCVLCICCVCVVCVCVWCVVQNKATDSHILHGWALGGDQTSTVSSFQTLCSRSSLIVMRVTLSHPFNNLIVCCMLGDVVGTEVWYSKLGGPWLWLWSSCWGPGLWGPSDVGTFSMLSRLPPETIIKELVMKLALSFHDLSFPSGSRANVQVSWVWEAD